MQENTTPPKKKMSIWIKIILGFFAVIFILGWIGSLSDTQPSSTLSEPESASEANNSTTRPINDLKAEFAEMDAKAKEESIKKLPALKKKFNYEKDEFKDTGWYTHKNQAGATRTTLLVHVNDKGFIYLESQYHREDWIFHDHVQVKAEELILSSPTVSRSDKNNVTQVADGVWENVHYLEGVDAIMTLIETNQKKIIKVRFEGRQYNYDMTLSDRDKTAIAEAIALSKAIRYSQT
jgi:hypothetical protein